MKGIGFTKEPQKSVWGVVIRIYDREATDAILMNKFSGFTFSDAVENANKKLNPVGFTVDHEMSESEIMDYLENAF